MVYLATQLLPHLPTILATPKDMPSPQPPTAQASKRLLHELKAIQSSPDSPSPALASLAPKSDTDLLGWSAVLLGPASTPYASGRWLISLAVPPSYPLAPPQLTFLTPCCHPNIHFVTGEVCLDLLRERWTPAYTLVAVCEAVQMLLAEPAVDSPLNVDLAGLLRGGDRVGFEGVVRFWCGERRWEG